MCGSFIKTNSLILGAEFPGIAGVPIRYHLLKVQYKYLKTVLKQIVTLHQLLQYVFFRRRQRSKCSKVNLC